MGRVLPGVQVVLLGLLTAGAATLGLTTPSDAPATLVVSHGAQGPGGSDAAVCEHLRQGRPLALTRSGAIETVDPKTASVTGVQATGAAPNGGLALDRRAGRLLVTAEGPDGFPAVWSIGCARPPAIVAGDAELPTVSPDDGWLAYVTINRMGQQSGVGIVALGREGMPTGSAQVLRATSAPPPNPIRGLALGRSGAVLAVWGGFVNAVLGPDRQTTGTLDPEVAHSLHALRPVITFQGISVPASMSSPPKAWQTAAVYLPNGELIVGLNGTTLTMPFSTAHSGGYRSVVNDSGKVVSLGAGPSGGILWVIGGGRLELTDHAWDFPFGPQAMTPPSAPPTARTVPGHFAAVAWTVGNGVEATTHPPPFSTVRLPSVVGMSEPQAVQLLDHLEVPSFVAHTDTDPTVPADTVLAQDPPEGVVEVCQCSVGLTVSSGGAPVTASRP